MATSSSRRAPARLHAHRAHDRRGDHRYPGVGRDPRVQRSHAPLEGRRAARAHVADQEGRERLLRPERLDQAARGETSCAASFQPPLSADRSRSGSRTGTTAGWSDLFRSGEEIDGGARTTRTGSRPTSRAAPPPRPSGRQRHRGSRRRRRPEHEDDALPARRRHVPPGRRGPRGRPGGRRYVLTVFRLRWRPPAAILARMPGSDLAERARALRTAIRAADHAYYVLDQPVLSDAEYDRLMRELQALEAEHPELAPADSPTQRVSGAPSERFARVVPPRADALARERPRPTRSSTSSTRASTGCSASPPRSRSATWSSRSSTASRSSSSTRTARSRPGSTRGDGVNGEDVTANLRTVGAARREPRRAAPARRARPPRAARGPRRGAPLQGALRGDEPADPPRRRGALREPAQRRGRLAPPARLARHRAAAALLHRLRGARARAATAGDALGEARRRSPRSGLRDERREPALRGDRAR